MTVMLDETSITILGAGNGGQAFAAYLKSKGYLVKLWNRSKEKIKGINKNKGITEEGLLGDHFTIDLVTTSLKEAIKNSKLIMVVISADGHKELSVKLAKYLNEDQVVVLNPGRTGGALEVSRVIKNSNGPQKPKIAEAQSLLFVSRSIKPGFVTIAGIKRKLPVAAFPSYNNDEILEILKQISQSFYDTETVLHTSFDNIGSIFHPTPLLLNAARCENPEVIYRHYIDGITPTISEFLEKIDNERLNIAKAYGISSISLEKWLKTVYGSKGKNLYEKIQNTEQYKDVLAPTTLNCRYIFEDVPTGLVPLACLGTIAGVQKPNIEVIINLANCVMNKNYFELGRTTDSMGLSEIPTHLIKDYVTFGEDILLEQTEPEVAIEE